MNEAPPSVQAPARRGFLERRLRLKWVVLLLGLLLLCLLAVWVAKTMEVSAANERARQAMDERAQAAADNLAETIAVFANRSVAERDYDLLQQYADNLISSRTGKGVVYIAVVDARGRAVVHTDRQFTGERFSGLKKQAGLFQSSARVMDLSRQVGTVHVGTRRPAPDQ